MKKWLPMILVALVAAWFLSMLRAPRDRDFAYAEFGRLPVVFNGRHKPIDSLARNSLLQIREKQVANLEPWKAWNKKPRIIPATEWLATVMMNPQVADEWPVFRIDHPELISLLHLPQKDPLNGHDGMHYSWNEIQPGFSDLQRENERVSAIESASRNPFEKAVVKMQERLMIYLRLKNSLQPPETDLPTSVAELKSVLPAEAEAYPALAMVRESYLVLQELQREKPEGDASTGRQLAVTQAAVAQFLSVAKTTQTGTPYTRDLIEPLLKYIDRFAYMKRLEPPLFIPAHQAGAPRDEWLRTGESLLDTLGTGKIDPAVDAYARLTAAFKAGDVKAFNEQVGGYRTALAPVFSRDLTKAHFEILFNRMQPFYNAMVIYVLAGLLAGLSWFNLSESFRRSAMWLLVLALVIHTTGLLFRMFLEGRPPVTNLYSSAIFIGWGAVVLGLVLERIFRDGIGSVVAASIGFITAIIAHHLAMEGDTMEMMRAVLDTNFWLATHVVIVTLGYASTFVAGYLAIIYIARGVFTSTLGEATRKSLTRMVYGIVCFATLFSFVGTVLGGIWADQSWGRFWGWDPKENGALIIVLWNALILHLRWGGIIRERGLINCAIFGNIVTSWSWFGVNMLGIGLHSYGFMDAAFWWLMAFVISQLALIGLGCLPLSMWKSFRGGGGTPPPAAPQVERPQGKPAHAA
jgi:ABC-type transport system involved in cytochrome c biogenesis permease subunit